MNVKLKSYLVLGFTFVLGLAGGIGLTLRCPMLGGYGGFHMGHGHHEHGPHGGFDPGAMLEKHILQVAEPNADQRVKLEPILAKYKSKLTSELDDHRARAHSLFDSLDVELGAVLDGEQMQKIRSHRDRPRGREWK